jgi:ubiquinone biosynthesis protein Coq4
MNDSSYAYSAQPTKNPFRLALALWRFMKSDVTDENVGEVAIIEISFARSRIGRRLAQWEHTIEQLPGPGQTVEDVRRRTESEPISLDDLQQCAQGSLGRAFADHCEARGLNPNLVQIPLQHETDWMLKHLFQTHDIWHVVTGWGNDQPGEVGLGGFYCGQLRSPGFFVFLLSLIWLKAVLRREGDLDRLVHAFVTGYQMGRQAQPLFGYNWYRNWDVPLAEVRNQLQLDTQSIMGLSESIMSEAA